MVYSSAAKAFRYCRSSLHISAAYRHALAFAALSPFSAVACSIFKCPPTASMRLNRVVVLSIPPPYPSGFCCGIAPGKAGAAAVMPGVAEGIAGAVGPPRGA